MSLQNYGVVKGQAVAGSIFPPRSRQNPPHYHIHLRAGAVDQDVAVNILSQDGSEVLYLVSHDFTPPNAQQLLALPAGYTALQSQSGSLALDFVKEHLVDKSKMTPLDIHVPPNSGGTTPPSNGGSAGGQGHRPRHRQNQILEGLLAAPETPNLDILQAILPLLAQNDLHNEIDDLIQRAVADQNAVVFAFGDQFKNAGGENPFFHFSPDLGIHDIHMNQGNPTGGHSGDNGAYQDGALLVYFPSEDRWLGAFLAFQTQSWQTDDQGNPS